MTSLPYLPTIVKHQGILLENHEREIKETIYTNSFSTKLPVDQRTIGAYKPVQTQIQLHQR